MSERSRSDFEAAGDESARQERLRSFTASLERDDSETVDFWRKRSPAEHAAAMIELSEYTEVMAAQTGLYKQANDMFPGFRRQGTA